MLRGSLEDLTQSRPYRDKKSQTLKCWLPVTL